MVVMLYDSDDGEVPHLDDGDSWCLVRELYPGRDDRQQGRSGEERRQREPDTLSGPGRDL